MAKTIGSSDQDRVKKVFNVVKKKSKEQESLKQPYNLFTMWDMSENDHTKLLLSLLRFKQDNKYVLIESFMKRFVNPDFQITQNTPIDIYYNRKYVYYQDKTNNSFIDGLILYQDDDNKKHAIIIENKIKDAPDQPDQVRRYIYHMHNQEHIELDNIWCFYIASDGSKSISEDSYTPSYEENNNPNILSLKIKKESTKPEEVNCHIGDRFIELNYKYDITSWLREDILDKRIYPESLTSVVRAYLESLEKDLFNDRANEDLYKEILQNLQGSSDDTSVNSVEEILKKWGEDKFENLLNLYDNVSNLKNEQDKGEGTEEMLSIDLEGLRRIIKSLISKIEQLAFDEFERCSVEILNKKYPCQHDAHHSNLPKWQAKHRGLSKGNGIVQLRLDNGWTNAHLEWIQINITKMYTATEYRLALHVENNKDLKEDIFHKLHEGQIDGVSNNNCLYSKEISTEKPLAKMETKELYEFLESVYCSNEDIKKCCNAIKETEVTKSNADTIPETNS